MNYLHLIDGTSAAIVLGGTLLATVMRCGIRNCLITLRGVFSAATPRFNVGKVRSSLALQIQDIVRDGLLRAEPQQFGDREFDEMADTLIERRSLGALLTTHQSYKAIRAKRSETTTATLNQAVELGPVFGLVGTLIALSQLPSDGRAETMLSANIPGAITTTLYGLLIANLIFAPLARFVQRRAEVEEEKRQELILWLTAELTRYGVMPQHRREEGEERFAA